MSEKDAIRQSMLLKRQQLTVAEMSLAAARASLRLQAILPRRGVVLLYSPFRNELSPWPVAKALLASGLPIALPRTDRRMRQITPVLAPSLDELVPGAYGILEPAVTSSTRLEPAQLSAVVVPGACFDRFGYRIGYGGGYYDRFLPQLAEDCLTIGFGYNWQLVPELAPDPWDKPLSYLVTDDQTIDCREQRRSRD